MSLGRRHVLVLGGGTALHAATLARSPEGWDGVGFLLSVERFDLASYRPHPPGYPVYVALLKLFAAVVGSPLVAAVSLSCLAGTAATLALGVLADRIAGDRAALAVMALFGSAPLVWRATTTVGTEGVALAFFATAAALLARGSSRGAGLALGLGLGVRLSWWPLALSALLLTPRAARRTVGIALLGSVLCWMAALAAVTGASRLLALFTEHAHGHFTSFGGGVLTDGGPIRLQLALVDVFARGLGMGTDALGLLAGAALLAAAATLRAHGAWARTALIASVPYTAWILVAQNVRYEPRHALPIVAMVTFYLGLALAKAPLRCAALTLVMGVIAWRDGRAGRALLPAGAQLATFVQKSFRRDDTLVYGGRGVRFLELAPDAPRSVGRVTMGDVVVDLTKQDVLPRHALVTDELSDLRRSPWPLIALERFCRPERLDPRTPCIELFEIRWPASLVQGESHVR
jgi:hypothetical protein